MPLSGSITSGCRDYAPHDVKAALIIGTDAVLTAPESPVNFPIVATL